MTCAKARYGFLLRSMADGMAGKSSDTMTADALVVRAAAPYFGLATKVIWPGPASSIPATPVISVSGEPFSSRAPMLEAMCESFMVVSRGENRNRDCNSAARDDGSESGEGFKFMFGRHSQAPVVRGKLGRMAGTASENTPGVGTGHACQALDGCLQP